MRIDMSINPSHTNLEDKFGERGQSALPLCFGYFLWERIPSHEVMPSLINAVIWIARFAPPPTRKRHRNRNSAETFSLPT